MTKWTFTHGATERCTVFGQVLRGLPGVDVVATGAEDSWIMRHLAVARDHGIPIAVVPIWYANHYLPLDLQQPQVIASVDGESPPYWAIPSQDGPATGDEHIVDLYQQAVERRGVERVSYLSDQRYNIARWRRNLEIWTSHPAADRICFPIDYLCGGAEPLLHEHNFAGFYSALLDLEFPVNG